jgi:hypothetical protein
MVTLRMEELVQLKMQGIENKTFWIYSTVPQPTTLLHAPEL